MGRKIPGKKHRTIKDPEKQREKRLSELQFKINNPPKNVDEQVVPKSLERVIKLKNLVKNKGLIKKKKRQKSKLISLEPQNDNKTIHPKSKPEKIVPVLKQRPNESSRAFLHRVNQETDAFIKETEFERKFNVQVKRNIETGEVEGLEKTPKDELDELTKLKLKHKNIKKKKKVNEKDMETRLTKSQKRKLKLQQKKQKKLQDKSDECLQLKDNIEFGEIIHAPPNFKVLPKKVNKSNQIKPGNKGLLLNSLFQSKTESIHESLKNNTINRSGKRKDLPIGERRQLEKQQNEAIAAYKLLKAKQSSS